jgi:hypothetical protein
MTPKEYLSPRAESVGFDHYSIPNTSFPRTTGIQFRKEDMKNYLAVHIKVNEFKVAPNMYETSVSDFKSTARRINFFIGKARRETITAETMREKAKIPAVYETKD